MNITLRTATVCSPMWAMSDDLDRENESDQDETNQEKRNP